MMLHSRRCACLLWLGLGVACGEGSAALFVDVPEEVRWVALLVEDNGVLSGAAYPGLRAVEDATPLFSGEAERVIWAVGWSEEALAPFLPTDRAEVGRAPIAQAGPGDEDSLLPVPAFARRVEPTSRSSSAGVPPPLTAPWLPRFAWVATGRASTPEARSYTALAASPDGEYALVFGGITYASGVTKVAAQATFRDAWELPAQPTVPAPRARHDLAIAHHPGLDRLVLFAGSSTASYERDTWTFDGARWELLRTAGAPPARKGASMAFDPERSLMVMYGGLVTGVDATADTWIFGGQSWSEVRTTHSPGPRAHATLLYSSMHHGLVLLGGEGTRTTHADAWIFNGDDWARAPDLDLPAPRAIFGGVALPSGRLLIYGGADVYGAGSPTFSDTLIYDGSWRTLSSLGAPNARRGHAMTYLAWKGAVLLFGGEVGGALGSPAALGDSYLLEID